MTDFAPSPELASLGLTPYFAQQFAAFFAEFSGDTPPLAGRVSSERRGEYQVTTNAGTQRASLSGRLAHELASEARPAVGDWVVMLPSEPLGRVVFVLERQSMLRRLAVDGTSRGQALAANVDVGFVVAALSTTDASPHSARRALNPRRIERYLRLLHEARIPATVIVNKADLHAEATAALEALREELPAVDALLVSAESGVGLDALRERIVAGATAVLLGSSGVGKSSLANRLLGTQQLRTAPVRAEDARGRHTTRERELVALPDGGILIDTPGMRELALWADADGETDSSGFAEIDELARTCRFRDCTHLNEPGCAVLNALATGSVDVERVEHARKLERELVQQKTRVDARLRQEQQRRQRSSTRALRARGKEKSGE